MLANPKIFKAYDVRGEWGKDWDADFVYNIGCAMVAVLQPKTVALGRDMRLSSPVIFQELSRAFIEAGVHVFDLGLCSTELTYFASSFVPEVDLAVMITASHNPGKDNGLKITHKGGIALGLSSGLDKIRDAALAGGFSAPSSQGTLKQLDLWQAYTEHVLRLANIDVAALSHLKIVADAGNGMGGYQFDKVLSSFFPSLVRLFWEPDGNFPNHPADPFQEKNVAVLKAKVAAENAAVGIAYDGDADRVFFVDEEGRYIPGCYLCALLSDLLLSKVADPSRETIVYDIRYVWAVRDVFAKHSATGVQSKVGHTLIKETMRQHHAIFAAEGSGHIFYRSNQFAESTMLTTLLILAAIVEYGSLAKLVDPYFEEYPISGEMNFIVDGIPDAFDRFQMIYPKEHLSTFDGVIGEFSDWRFNVRASNTQPLVRLNIEAKTKNLVRDKVEELVGLLGGEEVVD